MEILNQESPQLTDLFDALEKVENKMSELVLEVAKKEWMTSTELARKLNISKSTLAQFREAGMPHARIGTKVFYHRDGVEAFLEEHLVEGF